MALGNKQLIDHITIKIIVTLEEFGKLRVDLKRITKLGKGREKNTINEVQE